MTSPLFGSTALTVVITDTGARADLARCVHQLLRGATGTLDVAVASARSSQLPASLARKVRTLRVHDAAFLDEAVAREATRARDVVVASSTTSFAAGWRDELQMRAALHPRLISEVDGSDGGVLLFPAGVVETDAGRALWLRPSSIRPRAQRRTAPPETSLSAVMIVKNEEEVLGACLEAVAPFVDEVVVYDTGSSDRTVDIARSHGVVVVEGFWNDHFGDARNRALGHATSDWILQLDADEIVTGDARELRALLDAETLDEIQVKIISTSFRGATTGAETFPVRLFRRGGYSWVGALHEFPAPTSGSPSRGQSKTPAPIVLMHSGYEHDRVVARNKTDRNMSLAARELQQTPVGSPKRAELLSNHARSLAWAGRFEEAITALRELKDTPGNPSAIVGGGRAAVDIMFQLGRADEVEEWLDVMAANGEAPGNLAVARVRKHVRTGDLEAADAALTELLDGTAAGKDTWGVPFDRALARAVAAEVANAREDHEGALAHLLPLVAGAPHAVGLGLLLQLCMDTGRSMDDIVGRAPESLLSRSLRDVSTFHPVAALAWFDAFHRAHPHDPRPVVAGNVFAGRADWRTALTWAAYAAELGIDGSSALDVLAARESAPLLDRCIAWALLAEFFARDGAEARFAELTAALPPAVAAEVLDELQQMGISSTQALV